MGPSPHSTTTSLPHSKSMEPLTPKLQLNLVTSHCKSSQKRCTTSGATSPSTCGVIKPFTASRQWSPHNNAHTLQMVPLHVWVTLVVRRLVTLLTVWGLLTSLGKV